MASTLKFSFVYSGGPNNNDPSQSFGGSPSNVPVDTFVNNLFSDIEGTDQTNGLTDYRCIYVFNDDLSPYNNVAVWVGSQPPHNTQCTIGLILANEIQRMTLSNVAGGSITVKLDGQVTPAISYAFDPTTFASNVQTALRQLTNSRDVVVTSVDLSNFDIEWSGNNSNHSYPVIEIVSNNLTPNDPARIASCVFQRRQGGSPINAIAPDTGSTTFAPTGVEFVLPSEDEPIQVGILDPGEGMSIWIKRVSPPGVANLLGDFLELKFSAQIFALFADAVGGLTFSGSADASLTTNMAATVAIQERFSTITTEGLAISGRATDCQGFEFNPSGQVTACNGTGYVTIAGFENNVGGVFALNGTGEAVIPTCVTSCNPNCSNDQISSIWSCTITGMLGDGTTSPACDCTKFIEIPAFYLSNNGTDCVWTDTVFNGTYPPTILPCYGHTNYELLTDGVNWMFEIIFPDEGFLLWQKPLSTLGCCGTATVIFTGSDLVLNAYTEMGGPDAFCDWSAMIITLNQYLNCCS